METWNEPGADYFRQAMEELGIEDDELEDTPGDNTPKGDYPVFDRVMERAWELRNKADE